jgi:vancomycin permeability regulator SanA
MSKNTMKNRWRLIWWVVGVGLSLAVLVPVTFLLTTYSHRYGTVADVPARHVAIVLGAKVTANGTLSPILKDRVDGSVALFRAGKVQKLLMTGDNGSVNYDEVTAMKNYALTQDVPAEAIVLDYAGFSTYDSCYRAKAIFGVTSAVIVTQKFHAPRAVALCRSRGIDAVAYSLPDLAKYPDQKLLYVREYLAQFLADIDLIRQPTPVLGKFEGLL